MTTPPDTPSGPDPWHLRLLAYADHELDAPARREVEAELAGNPALAELLRDLQLTGRCNRELWAALAPPRPCETKWTRVRQGIAAQLTPTVPRAKPGRSVRWSRWAGVAAGLAVCVVVGLMVERPAPPPEPQGVAEVVEESVDPLAEYDVLPIATADDVMVSVVSGEGVGFASIDHPISGVMTLAGPDELEVLADPADGLSQPNPTDPPILMDK